MRCRFSLAPSAFLLTFLLGCGSGGGRDQGSPWSAAVVRSGLLEPSRSGTGMLERVFQGDAPLIFNLEADFQQLRDDREQDSEERPGRLVLGAAHGGGSYPVDIRTRGFFRLQPHVCEFPPLRLDFPSDSLRGSVLEGLDKVKLVTHCLDRDYHEQNILEEYLAYRIYGLLTEASFRVQLALITYLDASGRDNPVSRVGFLIEDEDAVADRMGGEILDADRASPNNFEPWHAGLVYLFQYLIGNTDWSLVRFHNVKLLLLGFDYIPLPYDFDFSGFVNAPYADPAPKLVTQIRSVRDRLYRGFCSEGIDHQALFQHFRERRDLMLELVQNQPGLTERTVRTATEYLESFFDIIDDPDRAQREIVEACRRSGI